MKKVSPYNYISFLSLTRHIAVGFRTKIAAGPHLHKHGTVALYIHTSGENKKSRTKSKNNGRRRGSKARHSNMTKHENDIYLIAAHYTSSLDALATVSRQCGRQKREFYRVAGVAIGLASFHDFINFY